MDVVEDYWPGLLCLVLAAALVVAEVTGSRRGMWLCKPAAAALFVVQALMLGATDSLYGLLVLAALVLCLAGDILLIPRGSEALFKAGIGAFLAGHIAYIAAFASTGVTPAGMQIGVLVTPALTVPFVVYLWPKVTPGFRLPVAAYTVVIAAMIFFAFGSGLLWQVPVAALMFAVSDMVVGRDRFVAEARWHPLVITPLYFGAQVLFAVSV